MADAMRKKVARAIGDADHGQQGRAALDACCYEELVEARRELHAWSIPFVEKTPISAETQWRRFPAAIKQATAVLAKVEAERRETEGRAA